MKNRTYQSLKIAFILIGFVGFWLDLPGQTIDTILPSREILSKWEDFHSMYPQSAVRWGRSGKVHKLQYFLTPAFEGTPEQKARTFLQQHADLFGMDAELSDLELVKLQNTSVQDKAGIDYLRFQQFYENVPVDGTETIVHITGTGSVFRVYNVYYPQIEIVNEQRINEEEAIDRARRTIDKRKLVPIEDQAELVIYRHQDQFYYAWRVLVSHWRFFIDAQTGRILVKSDNWLSCQYRPGLGDVYLENSCQNPEGPVQRHLTNLDYSGHLKGSNFDVLPLSIYDNRAYNRSANFFYDPSDPRFVEVEVFYQLEQANAYFGELGFASKSTPTVAFTNARESSLICNARYNLGLNYFIFGATNSDSCEGLTCNGNPGKDGNVIFHEYGHKVVHELANLDINIHSAISIHEAVADYFSGSYFGNSCLAETYESPCNSCMRDIGPDKKYPNDADNDDPHIHGLILASALWDIRALNDATTDWVVYETLKGLPSYAEFSDFAEKSLDVVAARIGDIDIWLVQFTLWLYMEEMKKIYTKHGIGLHGPYQTIKKSVSG